MPDHTIPSNFDNYSEGYIVIAPLSRMAIDRIDQIQQQYIDALGSENVWIPHDRQLHITFAHVVTPDAHYPKTSTAIFEQYRTSATGVLQEIVGNSINIPICFTYIEAFPTAIILQANDNGSYQKLRNEFIKKFDLPKGTRLPPEIIHTTLLRFKQPIDYRNVQKVTENINISFEPFRDVTDRFQLIRERKIFVQEHDVLQRFPNN